MAEVAPVLIIAGNHDVADDIAIYERLEGRHPIVVRTRPDVLELAGLTVFGFPFPWKRHWIAGHEQLGLDDQDRAAESDLRALLAGWSERAAACRAAGQPTVFLGHLTVAGSALAGGEVMEAGREITLSLGDLQGVGVDYVGLSHIHLAQELTSAIWYAGSPSRSTFGESDTKGFLLIDVEAGRPPVVHRRLTPARPFVTVDATWSLDTGDGRPGWVWEPPAADGAEVRVRVTLPEEAAATAPVDELESTLRAAGAVDVQIDRRVRPKQQLRCEAIVQAQTEEEMLAAYWSTLPAPPDAATQTRVLAKLAVLRAEVAA